MSKSDREAFRACSVAFNTEDAANEAVDAFRTEVEALRLKHRIANVLVTVKDSAIYKDGAERMFLTGFEMGAGLEMEGMAAWQFGQQQAARRAAINELATGKGIE